jgi:outer membrane cobalamin receptor
MRTSLARCIAASSLSFLLLASVASVAALADATATINGTVKTGAGAPVAGAKVSATGAASATAFTDAAGAFSLSLTPGIYRIAVEKGGFQSVSLGDVAAVAGGSAPLTITLSQADLSSLRTIGTVTAYGRGGASSINAGAAVTGYISAQSFANIADPQMNDVLQRIPDVTIQRMGSQQDTSIIVGGAQPYETQVLVDGHPVALGQYGVWLSQYFPTYLIGGVETQSGPGNTTPFANLAVGGTVNILTPSFTHQQTAELTAGIDNYASQYSNVLLTGAAGKLGYVAALGYGGYNGPYFKKQECAVMEDFATNANSSTSSGVVQFCGDMSGSLFTKGELLKMRYEFSPSTSFEAGYVGSFGGYSPQGAAWGNALGPTVVEECMTASPQTCTAPGYQNLVGKTINAYSWYPGTIITNVQQLWTGQFRSSIGNDTLLIRPYLGEIQPESYDGTYEGQYPSFFSPQGTVPSLAPGVQIPAAGLPNPNSFEASTCPPGSVYSFSQINSPQNTVVAVGGQEECFQYPYTFYEQDKLYGSTFSYIHPFGASYLDFTYDFHGQSTYAYANAPGNVTVPFSATRYSTFSLTSDLRLVRNLAIDIGLYTTEWTVTGEKAQLDASGNPVFDASGNPVLTGLDRTVARVDPHIALVLRVTPDDSYRVAWGTSETFPYVGTVSGTAAYQPFAQSAPLYTLGIFTEKNPNLTPESSSAFSAGVDHRFKNGSVLSFDVQDTNVRNVFQQLTLAENTTFQGQAGVLGIFLPINVAKLQTLLATLRYTYAPRVGLGYNVAVAADSSILSGIPTTAYNGNPGFPVNNIQTCGNGLFTPGLATCIPYLKGYAQATYTAKNGMFTALGMDYEGKNNPYYQPPFEIFDLTVRYPLAKDLELQASVENLLNTNNYSNLPEPNAGVPIVAETTTGQTTYASVLLPAPPRLLRVQAKVHVGR